MQVKSKKPYLKYLLACPLMIAAIFMASNALAVDLKMAQSLSSPQVATKQPEKSIIKRVSTSVSSSVSHIIETTSDWVGFKSRDGQYSLADGWTGRAIENTKSMLGRLPAPQIPFELRDGVTGLNIPLTKGSHLALGNLNTQYGQFYDSDQTGIHWVNKVDSDTSFYLGVQRNSGDAKETTSGMGFIYDLN